MKKVIATTNAPAAIGPYSQAIEYNGMVYASGQIPVNPATGEVESDNIEGQADQSLKNVGAILKEAGLDYSNAILGREVSVLGADKFVGCNGFSGGLHRFGFSVYIFRCKTVDPPVGLR